MSLGSQEPRRLPFTSPIRAAVSRSRQRPQVFCSVTPTVAAISAGDFSTGSDRATLSAPGWLGEVDLVLQPRLLMVGMMPRMALSMTLVTLVFIPS
jgi:hypothetical protein